MDCNCNNTKAASVKEAITPARVVAVIAYVALIILVFATRPPHHTGPAVRFEVARHSNESYGRGEHTINFEETLINDGDGMDALSGKFIAPIAGVYR